MSTKDEQIVKVEGWAIVMVPPLDHSDTQFVACDEAAARFVANRRSNIIDKFAHRRSVLLVAPEGSTQVPVMMTKAEVETEVRRVLLALDEVSHFTQYQWNLARELGYNLNF